MQNRLFFTASRSVTERLGELCNFVCASAVAMWSLRQQVSAFIDESETHSRTDAELQERFVKPAKVTSADLRTACISWSWETQQEQFAKILLFDLCSIYEAWLEDVVPRAVLGASEQTLAKVQKALQFPSSTDAKGNHGLKLALQVVNNQPSTILKEDVFPVLVKHKKNAWPLIENMLTAYRYFKECRNAFIHNGGIAKEHTEKAYEALRRLNASELGLHGPLKLPPVANRRLVTLALPDVVGLSSILHAMIVTLDAALAVSKGSERDMLARISEKIQHGRPLPKKDPDRRTRAILAMCRKAGLPEPVRVSGVENLLRTCGVI